MRRTRYWTHLTTMVVAFGFLTVASSTIQAQNRVTEIRSVTVSGIGRLQVVPDMATIRFGVVTRDLDPELARSENARAAAQAMDAIRDLGVPERKIRLDVLRLQPYREYDPKTRRNVDRGFEATREVSVKLEDLDLLPTLITRVVQLGANRINGITYGLQYRENSENQALEKALQNAQVKARIMASTLDAKLGNVLRITEQGVAIPQPVLQFERASDVMKADAAPVPEAYASGEMEIRASVTVVFELLSTK